MFSLCFVPPDIATQAVPPTLSLLVGIASFIISVAELTWPLHSQTTKYNEYDCAKKIEQHVSQ